MCISEQGLAKRSMVKLAVSPPLPALQTNLECSAGVPKRAARVVGPDHEQWPTESHVRAIKPKAGQISLGTKEPLS